MSMGMGGGGGKGGEGEKGGKGNERKIAIWRLKDVDNQGEGNEEDAEMEKLEGNRGKEKTKKWSVTEVLNTILIKINEEVKNKRDN